MTAPSVPLAADPIVVLLAYIGDVLGLVARGGDVDDELDELLVDGPVHRVTQYGGVPRSPNRMAWSVDIDTFAGPDADGNPDPFTANDAAGYVCGALLYRAANYQTITPAGLAVVSGVTVRNLPVERDWADDSPIRRYQHGYTVTIATRAA